jgi:hypothetical protein
MLCPVEHTEHDFVEPIKASHKKKSEKERERERVEREKAQEVADIFRKKQEELNKPVNPREPLKRTANNNWVHVTCAIFIPEVKFGNAKALEPSEGIPSIASARYDEICKACKKTGGACVACHSCKAPGKKCLSLTNAASDVSSPRGMRTPKRVYPGFRHNTSERIPARPVQYCQHR